MIPLLDTHQHLLYRSALTYDWADSLPPLAARDFSVSDYRKLTEGRGVAASIFMEVDATDYKNEARFINALAADPSNRVLALIPSCRPEEEDFDSWLEESDDMRVVGFRRILHETSDDLSRDDGFRRNVRKIGAQGKVFDMVFRADQLGIAREMSMACDDMTLVLDHCGVPNIAGGEIESWKVGITNLAALPHVVCKISGVLAYCAEGEASIEAIRPYVQHVIDCFGPKRLIWGSDWPVVDLKSDLPTWIDIFRALIEPLSEDEQRAICNENAQAIYGVSL